MTGNWGQYIVRVDGAIPRGQSGLATLAGIGKRGRLSETVTGTAAVVAIGSRAAWGYSEGV
ncbi:MAG: hypothetical protein WA970_23330 [Gammaproteobacteria bacterium]